MFGLATILEGLVGPWFKWVMLPVILVALLTTSHLLFESWKENLRLEGVRVCDSRWEEKVRTEERARVNQDLLAARSLLDAERKTNEGMQNENEKLSGELQELLSGSAGDLKCLSDGVLNRLRNGRN